MTDPAQSENNYCLHHIAIHRLINAVKTVCKYCQKELNLKEKICSLHHAQSKKKKNTNAIAFFRLRNAELTSVLRYLIHIYINYTVGLQRACNVHRVLKEI